MIIKSVDLVPIDKLFFPDSPMAVYLVRFYLGDFSRSIGRSSVIENIDGNFVYLYCERIGRTHVGSDKKKALSFSSAFLAIKFLGRTPALRSVRHMAFIDREVRGTEVKIDSRISEYAGLF